MHCPALRGEPQERAQGSAPPRPRPSLLTPFLPRIQVLLAEDPVRSAVNLLQRLRVEGYRGGITEAGSGDDAQGEKK